MKKIFNDIERYLLVNKPIVWISSIIWISGLCVLMLLIEVAIGFMAKPRADLDIFHTISLLLLVVLLFTWVSFQYRNYDKIFTIKQTFRIYLYNILGYILIYLSSLMLLVIMHYRFTSMTDMETFSKDLLSVRIANLRDSDIKFIRGNPQLFTSRGSTSVNNSSGSLDLTTEYGARAKLEMNPLIKFNISDKYPVSWALRKMQGYEYLDKMMMEAETSDIYKEIDEDPIFYKYVSGLSALQIDSLRQHSNEVFAKYGLEKHDSYDESDVAMNKSFKGLSSQVVRIEMNSNISKDKNYLTIIILMAICAVTFNFILTKNILCFVAPFVYAVLFSFGYSLFDYIYLKSLLNIRIDDNYRLMSVNAFLLILIFILLRWAKRAYNINILFFVRQLQNVSALFFVMILFIITIDLENEVGFWHIPLVVISVAAFLVTHYYFIRKMHSNLIQEF